MNIADLCQREIVTVSAKSSVREAAEAMRSNHVGALAVTDPDEPGRVMGIITDRDLVIDVLAQGRPPEGQSIGPLCRTDLNGVPATATVHEAVEAMQRGGVRRLLVVHPDGTLVGLISADDLFEAIANELDGLAGVLRIGIAREGARASAAAAGRDMPRALYLARTGT